MTIALSTLLSGLSSFLGARAVVTSATGGDATKIVDTKLSIYGDDYFKGWWAYITSGLADGDIRLIETFDKGTTTLDPYVDFTGAITSGDGYELNKHNKQDLIDALNDAIISIYPKLYRKIVFESLGYDLLNADVAIGATTVVLANDASLFFVGQVCTIGDTVGSETVTLLTVTPSSNTVTFAAIAGAYTTANAAYLVAKSGKYFNLGATIGNAEVTGVFVRADSTSARSPFYRCEIIQSLAGAPQIYFPIARSVDSQVWVIEAKARLEEVANPTDTITLDDEKVKLLYCQAAFHFYDRKRNETSGGDQRRLTGLSLNYRDQVFSTYRHLWMEIPEIVADISGV